MRRSVLILILLTMLYIPTQVFCAEPFDIGIDNWIGYAPFFLAVEKDFFQKLEVRLHRVDAEEQLRAGLSSGQLHMICDTVGMFQKGRDKSDYPGKIVFAMDKSIGADGPHVAISKEDVITARREDLEKIYEGWTLAVAYMREHPEDSARIIARATGMAASEFSGKIGSLGLFGKDENEKYFGVKSPCCPSDALITYNSIGNTLKKNWLTNVVSPGSEHIDYSIVGTVGLKRSTP